MDPNLRTVCTQPASVISFDTSPILSSPQVCVLYIVSCSFFLRRKDRDAACFHPIRAKTAIKGIIENAVSLTGSNPVDPVVSRQKIMLPAQCSPAYIIAVVV